MTFAKAPALLLAFFVCLLSHAPTLRAAEPATSKAAPALKVEVTGSGRPMILVPGLACGGNVWDDAVAHFKDTFQCHVVTLPGFAGQPAPGEPFLQQVGDLLSAYIRDQKLDHPIILGQSLGGFLGFWMAIEHPDQVGPIIAVDGVPYFPALLDPATTPKDQQATATQFRNSLKAQSSTQFARNNFFILATMISDGKNLQMVAKESNKSDPTTVGQAFYEIMTTDLREKTASIRSPILLLGAPDLNASAEARQKQEASYTAQVANIPNHRVAFAPKSRHFIQLDAPDFFFQQVDSFLKETSAERK
jgi:pimeloyl-ACP methyl ester carboxylesterase